MHVLYEARSMGLEKLCSKSILLACVLLMICGCAAVPSAPEGSTRPVPGYLDYSYDKNSILFNVKPGHLRTVFLDTIIPFDPTLRYKHAEALVRYELAHEPYLQNGVLMVALSDLRKLYAPYFSYTIDHATQRFSVEHHFFRKKVLAGSGSRAPNVEYTKVVWRGDYRLSEPDAVAWSTSHVQTNDRSKIDSMPAAISSTRAVVKLGAAPQWRENRIFVPLASFMRSLGKTISDDARASGYLAVSSVSPTDTADDLFNPKYAAGYSYLPLTSGRIRTMNGLLSGAIDRGNLWFAEYFGQIDVFTGKTDAAGRDVRESMNVDRLLPFRLYVPRNYDPGRPSRFTFMLHGATGNENAPFERPNDHLVNHPATIPGVVKFEDFADHYDYIVLSPNGWTRNPVWGSGPGEQVMLRTLDWVKKRYSVDPNRMFIFGNSAGGSGTMNFVSRHGRLFKAMAPTAPASTKPFAKDMVGVLRDMPALISCFAADVTVFYAGPVARSCQPWYQENVRNAMPNATVLTVENAHHSYGPASVYEMTFDFFERALDPGTAKRVGEVRFAASRKAALVATSAGQSTAVALSVSPIDRSGTLLVALDDLARIYGPSDFKIYDMHAYNNRVDDLVSVKTVIYANMSVNFAPGKPFLRVGGAVHAGDTTGPKTRVAADDPRIDRRTFAMLPEVVDGKVYVPVVEFMRLFGKAVTVEPRAH